MSPSARRRACAEFKPMVLRQEVEPVGLLRKTMGFL